MFIVLENDFFFYSIGLTFLLSLHKILKTRRTKTLSQELFLPNLKKQIDNIHNWNCNNNLRFSQAQKQLLPLQFHLQFFYVQTYSTSLYCTMAYEMIQLASWGERKWKNEMLQVDNCKKCIKWIKLFQLKWRDRPQNASDGHEPYLDLMPIWGLEWLCNGSCPSWRVCGAVGWRNVYTKFHKLR